MAEPTKIDLSLIEELISSKFEPAVTEAEADLLLTTEQLMERIKDFDGQEIDKLKIVEMLLRLDFVSKPNSDMHFVWLFKEK